MDKRYKYADVSLPVFKQGSDLGWNLENSDTNSEAFLRQAEQYEDAARICREMASFAAEHELEIDADTHMICVAAEASVIDLLTQKDYASTEMFDDMEEDDAEWDEPLDSEDDHC